MVQFTFHSKCLYFSAYINAYYILLYFLLEMYMLIFLWN